MKLNVGFKFKKCFHKQVIHTHIHSWIIHSIDLQIVSVQFITQTEGYYTENPRLVQYQETYLCGSQSWLPAAGVQTGDEGAPRSTAEHSKELEFLSKGADDKQHSQTPVQQHYVVGQRHPAQWFPTWQWPGLPAPVLLAHWAALALPLSPGRDAPCSGSSYSSCHPHPAPRTSSPATVTEASLAVLHGRPAPLGVSLTLFHAWCCEPSEAKRPVLIPDSVPRDLPIPSPSCPQTLINTCWLAR